MISIRTYDEETAPTTIRLFSKARSPEEMLHLSMAEIDEAIQACTFHEAKAKQILDIAQTIVRVDNGQLLVILILFFLLKE